MFVRNRVSLGSSKGLVHKLEYWILSTYLKSQLPVIPVPGGRDKRTLGPGGWTDWWAPD